MQFIMHAGVVVVVLPRQFFAFLSLQSKHKGEKERETLDDEVFSKAAAAQLFGLFGL